MIEYIPIGMSLQSEDILYRSDLVPATYHVTAKGLLIARGYTRLEDLLRNEKHHFAWHVHELTEQEIKIICEVYGCTP